MFICSKCDAQSLKWSGRCTECGSWGTISEEGGKAPQAKHLPKKKAVAQKSTPLSEQTKQEEHERFSTGIEEIDRVFGGGIVKGSLVLIAGEPGIGKSTLVAALAGHLSSKTNSVLYVSGEESPSQLSSRFARLKQSPEFINIIEPFPVETLIATIEKEHPALVVIDSIQTLSSSEIESPPGTPTLVRYATSLLLDLAKRTGISILLVGQVTKDGSVAGPKTLEHLVDAVLSLEGDPVHAYRLFRCKKNRFGSTDEIGVFEMTSTGLIPVLNPSECFLKERANTPGSVITATIEGSRVFLVEVQALVEKTSYGMPVRRASGFEQNRLQMLIAILSKRAGIKLGDQDIYVNVIGGLSLEEPAVDLAICGAIVSAVKGTISPATSLYLGEVGLGGEVRSVPLLERRLEEAKRMGMTQAYIPSKKIPKTVGIELKMISSLKEL
ncbi:MAG: repair protein radA protein [Candidatus Uhrbacteria bacterium GW2011_GWE2_40_58]|nr:MAG: repair protein radA protein [Candidatus Uhrbacteria bacterium GW2011_GWF2_40_263]KKR68167.1 MAG: repair protein radA protein [Candidatus Uhrbacteria bacterium GW2011_GWE2_40_58]OGL91855.1 MAG: DNA repair protein RadA [Candidatus Uhrbacteria bacterium RIFOXYA2_FULL_40_9]OGL97677.1 MAG: DNA repair protein RadA [Candidatus Uhrbacteria bacterium RIFOXYB2_FULL_41_18]HBK34668.1 DNA repair protein RadA [Candidatus Uhrbacteria bacterium]